MPSVSLPTLAMTAGLSGEAVGTAATIGAALPTFGSVATAASLAGTALGGLGTIQSSRAASASAGYNAQVVANNATLATQNAQFAAGEGEQNAAASGAKTRAVVGATLANQGASGVDVNTGSAVDVRESEAKLGMLNTLNIRSEAARQAYGFETQSQAFTSQAALDKSQQTSDKIGGYLNAGASVLGGISSASKYATWLNGPNSTTAGLTNNTGGYDLSYGMDE